MTTKSLQDLDPFTDIVKFSGRHGTQAHKPPQLPPHLRTVRGHFSASHAEPAGKHCHSAYTCQELPALCTSEPYVPQ